MSLIYSLTKDAFCNPNPSYNPPDKETALREMTARQGEPMDQWAFGNGAQCPSCGSRNILHVDPSVGAMGMAHMVSHLDMRFFVLPGSIPEPMICDKCEVLINRGWIDIPPKPAMKA